MGHNQNQEDHFWDPQHLGIMTVTAFVAALELHLGGGGYLD
jgi:hypothetical protein